MEPTDYAFCGCGVQEGVQFLAIISAVNGLLAMIQCLTDMQVEDPLVSEPTYFVHWIDNVVASFGLCAGLAGYQGATSRDFRKSKFK